MSVQSPELIQKLDSLSFQSLDKLSIDWRSIIKNNPQLLEEYNKFLCLKSQYIIVNVDYNQLELYSLASLSRDENMIATVMSGKDIHAENAKKMHNIDYEELERQEKILLEKYGDSHVEYLSIMQALKDFKAKRKSAKSLSFSLSYGAGKEKIAMDNKISEEAAQKLIDGFYTIYPKAKEWQNRTFLGAINNGYIETPFGRRRATPKVYGRMDAYYALVDENPKYISKLKKQGEYWKLREEFKTTKNSNIQSTATDMCSLAACKFKEWLKTANKRAEMYFWVHDAIVFAVHIDDAVEVIEVLRNIMENQVKYPGDPVNYRTAMDVGYNYEWTVEIKHDEWIKTDNKQELLVQKLAESLDVDRKKKFKLIVKSTASDILDTDKYIKTVKDTKETYFEKLIEHLNIDGIYTPKDYMLYMNNCSEEEYDNYFNFDQSEEDLEE